MKETDNMEVYDSVLKRVKAAILKITPQLVDLKSDQELLESGLLDSLSVMRLIAQVEMDFEIKLPMMELTVENLATPDAITVMVQHRLKV
jgi:acyl carrier protein